MALEALGLAPCLKYQKLAENLPKLTQIWPWTCHFFRVQIRLRGCLNKTRAPAPAPWARPMGPGPMGWARGPGPWARPVGSAPWAWPHCRPYIRSFFFRTLFRVLFSALFLWALFPVLFYGPYSRPYLSGVGWPYLSGVGWSYSPELRLQRDLLSPTPPDACHFFEAWYHTHSV